MIKLQEAFNEQLNKEFFSSYLYLSMNAYFESKNLLGFANWMKVQYEEEKLHAEKIYGYINNRGWRVKLKEIKEPRFEWESVLNIFTDTLKHEQYITKSIQELMDLSIELKDHASQSFLKWFIDEQVEEETNVSYVLEQVKLIQDAPGGLYMLDKELASRTFQPAAPNSE